MSDIVEVKKLLAVLETQLSERGFLNGEGLLASHLLTADLSERLDGLIENTAELDGLLLLAHAARRGESLSLPVALAVRIMLEEVCQALI